VIPSSSPPSGDSMRFCVGVASSLGGLPGLAYANVGDKVSKETRSRVSRTKPVLRISITNSIGFAPYICLFSYVWALVSAVV
jgi:hypothetical protein